MSLVEAAGPWGGFQKGRKILRRSQALGSRYSYRRQFSSRGQAQGA